MAGHPTVSGLPDYAKTPEGYARFAAETSAGSTFATTIALLIVTTIVVGLRLLSRRIARLGFWWDDYITVLAWAMAVVVSMEGIVLPLLGLGHHTVTILPLLEREQRVGEHDRYPSLHLLVWDQSADCSFLHPNRHDTSWRSSTSRSWASSSSVCC